MKSTMITKVWEQKANNMCLVQDGKRSTIQEYEVRHRAKKQKFRAQPRRLMVGHQ